MGKTNKDLDFFTAGPRVYSLKILFLFWVGSYGKPKLGWDLDDPKH
jgi:hypothetical protein